MANRTITGSSSGTITALETVAQNGIITGITMGYEDGFDSSVSGAGKSLLSVMGMITINGQPGIALQHDIVKAETKVLGHPPRYSEDEGGSLKIPVVVGDVLGFIAKDVIYEVRPDTDGNAVKFVDSDNQSVTVAVSVSIEDVV